VAEAWYRKSLAINEKNSNEQGLSRNYFQLGTLVQEEGNFRAAEAWYRKSLAIELKQPNENAAGIVYAQLGYAAALQENYEAAGNSLISSILCFARGNNTTAARKSVGNFLAILERAEARQRPKLRAAWERAGLIPIPEDFTAEHR
jgi:tetratricopeptide (TPR) repeat protein